MMAQTETEIVQGIGSDYGDQVRLLEPDEAKDYFFKSRPRPLARARRRDLRAQERARLDAQVPPQVARLLPTRARCRRGAAYRRCTRSTSTTSSTTSSRPRIRPKSWEDLPADIKDTWDKLGIPEAEKKYLAGVGAQYESEVVYHKLQEDLDDAGRDLPRHGHGAARARGALQAVLRDDHPAERQQVRGAELAPSGRAARSSTCRRACTIELPLQAYFRINAENMGQFERTLIIVDEGAYVHYVEGCTAPIYSTDSLHSRGRRDRRQEGRPLPLHDDPELVEQRLQPRHEARRRLRGRDDGVGRRQPRLEADDEVPGDLADGRARARRGAVDRVRRQGPASGRGRQVRPRRAEHDVA